MGNAASDIEGSGFIDHELSKSQRDEVKEKDGVIRDELKKRAQAQSEIMKLLLLGAGESGKTTVLRQMTLIHGIGFDDKYRKQMKSKICFNVIEGAAAIVEAAKMKENFLEGPDKEKAATLVSQTMKDINMVYDFELNDEVVDAILLLSNSDNFEESFRGKIDDLSDGWWYFRNQLKTYPAWGGDDWLPSDNDILHARVRTTGIHTQEFQVEKAQFFLTDVGGQRNERRKWIRLFNGVTGVIFVASLSCYNQVLFEDRTVNRLRESVDLWDQTIHNAAFKNTAFLLFLNKFDLFQKKYYQKKIPIEYKGPFVTTEGHMPPKVENEKDEGCENAIEWYKELYLHRLDPSLRKMVYIHITTALDKNHMKKVMNSCAVHIMQQSLFSAGLAF